MGCNSDSGLTDSADLFFGGGEVPRERQTEMCLAVLLLCSAGPSGNSLRAQRSPSKGHEAGKTYYRAPRPRKIRVGLQGSRVIRRVTPEIVSVTRSPRYAWESGSARVEIRSNSPVCSWFSRKECCAFLNHFSSSVHNRVADVFGGLCPTGVALTLQANLLRLQQDCQVC